MRLRLVLAFLGLAISFTLPIFAEEKQDVQTVSL